MLLPQASKDHFRSVPVPEQFRADWKSQQYVLTISHVEGNIVSVEAVHAV
jgi:hypothetical protein